jgi:hypothetical protein
MVNVRPARLGTKVECGGKIDPLGREHRTMSGVSPTTKAGSQSVSTSPGHARAVGQSTWGLQPRIDLEANEGVELRPEPCVSLHLVGSGAYARG